MSLNNITSFELRKLISIVERKESVQEELAEIESKLSALLSDAKLFANRSALFANDAESAMIACSLL
jgi:hypothetical protein